MNPMIITDEEPVREAIDEKLAEVMQLHARAQTMAKLIAGHIVAVKDVTRDEVIVTVGDNEFACPVRRYPSEEFIAHIMLAVGAGEAERVSIPDFERDGLMQFTPANKSAIQMALHRTDAAGAAEANVARLAYEMGKQHG
jgi:hypothetical protein